ncbi:hypothetical protein [Mobiluncus curtisii]|uniref:hypothetical protein n=1 Tax=Mobiluncus curtisii TaxID=2051 RepID=UPI001470336A|nr:hypothetical protein [Mobiluncus curtisii]NMW88073.1 hypothetical protein [Mobiluncus curtisii]
MKNIFHTWLNNLHKPSPGTLDHGSDVPKNYNYPVTIPGDIIRRYTDRLLDIADTADQYVNDPKNWRDREEIQWQAGHRDALLNSVEDLRRLIDTTTPPLDMSLVETLFPKQAS